MRRIEIRNGNMITSLPFLIFTFEFADNISILIAELTTMNHAIQIADENSYV